MEMQKNTIVLPKISEQTLLAKYYSMADVFTICSKKENFPTTCIEAQCCGTPVTGFDTGGTKETIVYNEGGGVVSYGDVKSLKENVLLLFNQETEDLANKAQAAYSKENMFDQYLKEYDQGGRKQRILLIDVNCKYSSTGKIVYDLYQNLRKAGREAAICYGRGELIREDRIYKFGLDLETYVHAFLARITGYNGIFSPFSTQRLIKYIDKYKPDIIHIHELHAYFVNLKPLLNYIKKKKIKVVWTFHCEYMYTGKCGYAYSCVKFQKECHKCPAVKDYPKSLFFDRTKQMFRMKKRLLSDMDMTIVTPSKWLADRVKCSFLKNMPIRVIHNGIDTSVFRPVSADDLRTELGIPRDHKIVLSVAPDIMSERKGGRWVLKLANMMKNEKITFILVGGGGKRP